MDIIHNVNGFTILPRHIEKLLSDSLRAMPAIVVTGARQTGKSTLASKRTPTVRRFLSLDELDVLDLARREPESLVESVEPITLDEVQREPDVLLAVKRSIDRARKPGWFLITGSANLLLMRAVSESLAGRASFLTLWPMTHREQRGLGRCGMWDELLTTDPSQWVELLAAQEAEAEDWREQAMKGGFPTPAIHMDNAADRCLWFEGYTRSYLERDLQSLANISALPDFRRLMRAACLRIGSLANQTDLGRDLALPQPTVHRYLNLLETSYFLVRLPAYSVNRTKRLIKTPKMYWSDVGLALYLAGISQPEGHHLENLILGDLLAWRDGRSERAELLYWRTTSGEEVDFVIETAGRLLPVEVKAASRARMSDAAHIRTFRREYADSAMPGIVIHTGDSIEWLTSDALAVPWWRVI